MQCVASECVKMLLMCFAALASLALAAPGISRTCFDYCKTKHFAPINHIVPLGCNCADVFLDTETESKQSSSITLDDTGVYFVPADVDFIQDPYDFHPFFISNPAKLVPKTRNAVNREIREFESSNILVNDPLPSQSTHIDIYKKTETILHTTMDKETEKSPLYLDLEILDSTGSDRSAVQKYTFIEDYDETEKALVQCLDFQVVHYTRKYGQVKKFQDFWKARNLNQYEQWSDFDVEKNIQSWCSEPDSIVRNSLHEIKQGLPKKVPESRTAEINRPNISATITAELTEPEITTYPLASSGHYNNVTEPTETINDSTEAATMSNIVTKSFESINNSTENTTVSSTSNKENIYEENLSTFKNTQSDTTSTTIDSTLFLEDPNKTKTTVYLSNIITTIEPETDLDTMASEDVLHTFVPALTEVKNLDNNNILNNNTSVFHVSTTPLTEERSRETDSTITTVSDVYIYDAQSLIKNNTLLNDSTQSPDTNASSEYRNAYEENEMKIPRIITKECQNNTIQTVIDGTEELPNNDFRHNESDITGRLYFVSNQQLVPVRFVQTNGGAISLGMDGSELCNKLFGELDKKSHFLSALCEFIQNKSL